MEQLSVSPTEAPATRTRGMRRLEERLKIDLEVFLRDRYAVQGRTQEQIAAELKVDTSTVTRWMARLGIEARLFASDSEQPVEAAS